MPKVRVTQTGSPAGRKPGQRLAGFQRGQGTAQAAQVQGGYRHAGNGGADARGVKGDRGQIVARMPARLRPVPMTKPSMSMHRIAFRKTESVLVQTRTILTY